MGFVVLFTLGGVTGVILAEPPADFQLHNSLFLVAHFHTMIVSGVLFGYFAGLTYWFPKIFGFTIIEKIERRALWCWVVGFILAFGPLYILGFMGATRRLDHYSASLGWQPLFIVAGVGAVIIALGIAFQVYGLMQSIRTRGERRDITGDPWDGRTLEWSTRSPAPAYNFAVLPIVDSRDAFWAMKQKGITTAPNIQYEDIVMPKNTGAGVIIAVFVFLFGFSIVWAIWWLTALSLCGAITAVIMRAFDEHTEYILSAEEVARIESAARTA